MTVTKSCLKEKRGVVTWGDCAVRLLVQVQLKQELELRELVMEMAQELENKPQSGHCRTSLEGQDAVTDLIKSLQPLTQREKLTLKKFSTEIVPCFEGDGFNQQKEVVTEEEKQTNQNKNFLHKNIKGKGEEDRHNEFEDPKIHKVISNFGESTSNQGELTIRDNSYKQAEEACTDGKLLYYDHTRADMHSSTLRENNKQVDLVIMKEVIKRDSHVPEEDLKEKQVVFIGKAEEADEENLSTEREQTRSDRDKLTQTEEQTVAECPVQGPENLEMASGNVDERPAEMNIAIRGPQMI
eukprot:XP_017948143.1 PREDICTED: uncharacterized protein LOC101733101 [Xenopus tropicalis]